MNRIKLFIENFYIYGFIAIVQKLVPVILLPVITHLLPNSSDFGVYDTFTTMVLFLSGIVTLGVYNSLFREFFDMDTQEHKYNVTRTATVISFTNTVIVCVGILCCMKYLNFIFPKDANHIIIAFMLVTALSIYVVTDILRIIIRVKNQRKVALISGLLGASLEKIIAVGLILIGFSFYGLIFAGIVANIFVLTYLWKINGVYLKNGNFDRELAIKMLKFGLPLVPVIITFWVNNSMNRFFILYFFGFSAEGFSQVGIFGVGARLALISNFIHGAMSAGWGYFLYSVMNHEDFKEMMSKLFCLMVAACSVFYFVLFLLKDIIFNLLFSGEYVKGVVVFPYLLMAPLFLVFTTILEGNVYVKRKTYYSTIIYGIGCVVNICLCLILIPKHGIVGAAIGTCAGFFTSFLLYFIVSVVIKKYIVLDISGKFLILSFITLFVFVNYFGLNYLTVLLIICYIITIFFLYFKQGLIIYKRWRGKNT